MAVKFANNNSLSAITSLPASITSGVGGGSLNLISTQTASSSSTISFTSGIDSTYDEYVFKFYDIHCGTEDEDFCFQVDTGTNTNYNQTITSTYFNAMHSEGGSGGALEYNASKDQAQAQGLSVTSGELRLFSPSSTTFVKHFLGRSNNVTLSDYSIDSYFAGYVNTTTALTRVQFKMSSGTFDGVIKLYGIS